MEYCDRKESLIHELFLTWGVEVLLPLVKLLHHIGRWLLKAFRMLFTFQRKMPEFHMNSPLSRNFLAVQSGFSVDAFTTNPFAVAAINLYISIACLRATGPDASVRSTGFSSTNASPLHIGGEEVFTQIR